jgi:hypothetical protein
MGVSGFRTASRTRSRFRSLNRALRAHLVLWLVIPSRNWIVALLAAAVLGFALPLLSRHRVLAAIENPTGAVLLQAVASSIFLSLCEELAFPRL